jgi:hypothetical protein
MCVWPSAARLSSSPIVTESSRNWVHPEASRSPLVADAILAEAVRQGWITPPALPARGVPPRNPVMPFRKLKHELEDDRSER